MAQMVAARPGMLHACIERHAFLTHKRTHTNTPRSMPGGIEQQGEQNKQEGLLPESHPPHHGQGNIQSRTSLRQPPDNVPPSSTIHVRALIHTSSHPLSLTHTRMRMRPHVMCIRRCTFGFPRLCVSSFVLAHTLPVGFILSSYFGFRVVLVLFSFSRARALPWIV